jgi:hypothetical protein
MINSNYPLSGQDMIYSIDEHRYILLSSYVTLKTGIDLSLYIDDAYVVDKTTAVNSMLSDISNQIYCFVYSYNSDNNYQEWLMAKSEMARGILSQAMLLQLGYILANGKSNEFVGLNIDTPSQGAKNDLEDLRGERSIHPEAIQLLRRKLETGDSLLYSGEYEYSKEIASSFRNNY